ASVVDKVPTPYAKDCAHWYQLQELRATGEQKAADELIEKLGFTTKWYVMGSFDNERGNGFGNASEAEEKPFDPKASYKGKERQVTWRPVPVEPSPWGDVDLAAMLRPQLQALAYAISYVHCDADQKGVLRIGSDEALKVWV